MFCVLLLSTRTFWVQKKESANFRYLLKNTPPPGTFSKKLWLSNEGGGEGPELQSSVPRPFRCTHFCAVAVYVFVLWTWSWHPGKTIMSGWGFTWAYVVTLGLKPRKSEGSNRHFRQEQDGNRRRKRARVFKSHLVGLAQGWLIIHHHRTRHLFQKGFSVEGNHLDFYGINPGD